MYVETLESSQLVRVQNPKMHIRAYDKFCVLCLQFPNEYDVANF